MPKNLIDISSDLAAGSSDLESTLGGRVMDYDTSVALFVDITSVLIGYEYDTGECSE